MTTALATRDTAAPAVTKDQLDLVKRTVATGASDAELKLYLYDCERQGVHPLDRLLHFTKRGGKYTPVTSIDLMRIRAAETGEYAGSDDAEFGGSLGSDWASAPIFAKVTVWRLVQGTRCAFTATARWSEYCPASGQDHMWRKMPHTMLAKCAEALALRKGFPRQLAGLYAREEMDQAGPLQADSADAGEAAQRGGGARRVQGEIPAPAPDEGPDLGIDTDNGMECDDEPPPGYHYISGYNVNGQWHEAHAHKWTLQGDPLKVSTKRPSIGNLLAKASNDHIPAKLDVTVKNNYPGEAYVNAVTLLQSDADLDAEIAKREMAKQAGEVL